MKHQITQILNRNIVADATVAKLVQAMCFVASIVLLFLPIRVLAGLGLAKSQMLFGVLLSFVAALLLIVLGILLPMAIAPKKS